MDVTDCQTIISRQPTRRHCVIVILSAAKDLVGEQVITEKVIMEEV